MAFSSEAVLVKNRLGGVVTVSSWFCFSGEVLGPDSEAEGGPGAIRHQSLWIG